jgi:hypothetical protein
MTDREERLGRREFIAGTVAGAAAFGAAAFLPGCKKQQGEPEEPAGGDDAPADEPDEMAAMLGCCGKDCAACGKCAGCQEEGKEACVVRTCCMGKDLADCSECPGVAGCQKLDDFAAKSEMNKAAVETIRS